MDHGRPTKFKEEYAQELLDYFNVKPYREVERQIVTKSGDAITVVEDVPNDFPTLAGFACEIGVHRDTLHEWSTAENEDGSQKYPDFSDAYKMAKLYQERILVTNGLRSLYHGSFAIFTAKNVIGYRDKQELEHTGANGGAIQSETRVEIDVQERVKQLKGGSE